MYITGPSLGGFLIDTVGWRWILDDLESARRAPAASASKLGL